MIGHPPPDPADWYDRDASFNRSGKVNGKGPTRRHRARRGIYIAICGFILLVEESGSPDHEGRACLRCLRIEAAVKPARSAEIKQAGNSANKHARTQRVKLQHALTTRKFGQIKQALKPANKPAHHVRNKPAR